MVVVTAGLAAHLAAAAAVPPCTDSVVSQFALALAVGPSLGVPAPRAPRCVPTQAQALWALPALSSVLKRRGGANATAIMRRAARPAVSLYAGRAGTAEEESQNTEVSVHLAHLYVVQSNSEWCPSPCQGPTWELASPKPNSGSPYALFEAAIWRQERRVALYRFDAAWMQQAHSVYHDICHGQGWSCPAYRAFREGRVLLSVGPWPASADKDPQELSKFLLGAFQQVFLKLGELAPSAENFALTYSGHGARADGSLFEGAIQAADATALLRYASGIGQSINERVKPLGKLSILNFGGNCAESRWNMLANLYPFADWIVASDLPVGGVKLNETEQNGDTVLAMQLLDDMHVMLKSAESLTSIDDVIKDLVAARSELWQTAYKAAISRQRLQQSIAAFKSSLFEPFRHGLRQAYKDLPPAARSDFQEQVERHSCDVLASARFLDGQVASQNQVNSLAERFELFRPIYASTRDLLVDWPTRSNGLGFNFLGWQGPPCDLAGALGKDAPPPPKGWNNGSSWQR